MSGEKLVLRDEGEQDFWRGVYVEQMRVNREIASLVCEHKMDFVLEDEAADCAVRAYRERCGSDDLAARSATATDGPKAVSEPEIRLFCAGDGTYNVVCGDYEWTRVHNRWVDRMDEFGRMGLIDAQAVAADLRRTKNFPKAGGGA